ncbi:E3 ubiquitin-protein ligase TOM1-like [Astathelohania contejeani]|uniref:HECT-type E3 ubiquitin transferase n=1 Tax=Astathelohania contejeani TaxID=164912 RepID=A0ABQ7HWI2_9MICR|nr:E3 ubiquitin-protein ligase TOM1-like [Thelohania contejeani]
MIKIFNSIFTFLGFMNQETSEEDKPIMLKFNSICHNISRNDMRSCFKAENKRYRSVVKNYFNLKEIKNSASKYCIPTQKCNFEEKDISYINFLYSQLLSFVIFNNTNADLVFEFLDDSIFYIIYTTNIKFLIEYNKSLLRLMDYYLQEEKAYKHLITGANKKRFSDCYKGDNIYIENFNNEIISINDKLNAINNDNSEEATISKIRFHAYILWSTYYFLFYEKRIIPKNLQENKAFISYIVSIESDSQFSIKTPVLLYLLHDFIDEIEFTNDYLENVKTDKSIIYDFLCLLNDKTITVEKLKTIIRSLFGLHCRLRSIKDICCVIRFFIDHKEIRSHILTFLKISNDKMLFEKLINMLSNDRYDETIFEYFIEVVLSNKFKIENGLYAYNNFINECFRILDSFDDSNKNKIKEKIPFIIKILLSFLEKDMMFNIENKNDELEKEYYYKEDGIFIVSKNEHQNLENEMIHIRSDANNEKLFIRNIIDSYRAIIKNGIKKRKNTIEKLINDCLLNYNNETIKIVRYCIAFMMYFNIKYEEIFDIGIIPILIIRNYYENDMDGTTPWMEESVILEYTKKYCNDIYIEVNGINSFIEYNRVLVFYTKPTEILIDEKNIFDSSLEELSKQLSMYTMEEKLVTWLILRSKINKKKPWGYILEKLTKRIIDKKSFLFARCNDDDRHIFAPRLFTKKAFKERGEKEYRFIGQIIGLAMKSGFILPYFFPDFIYEKLVNKEYDVSKLYEELNWVNLEIQHIDYNSKNKGDSIKLKYVDIRETKKYYNSEIKIFYNEKAQNLYSNFKLNLLAEIKRKMDIQIETIKQGILDVIPEEIFNMVDNAESLKALISGDYTINIDQLKPLVGYKYCTEKHNSVQLLWKYIDEKLNEKNRRLLFREWSGLGILSNKNIPIKKDRVKIFISLSEMIEYPRLLCLYNTLILPSSITFDKLTKSMNKIISKLDKKFFVYSL